MIEVPLYLSSPLSEPVHFPAPKLADIYCTANSACQHEQQTQRTQRVNTYSKLSVSTYTADSVCQHSFNASQAELESV